MRDNEIDSEDLADMTTEALFKGKALAKKMFKFLADEDSNLVEYAYAVEWIDNFLTRKQGTSWTKMKEFTKQTIKASQAGDKL